MKRLTAQQIEGLPEWMAIEGFEGVYEVNCREGIVRNSRNLKVLKARVDICGYPKVELYKDSKIHYKTVHRIVANAAFGYYNISTVCLLVMHLDEERHNPRIDNLAIGTQKENLAFPKARKRLSETARGEKNHFFGKHHSEETRLKISQSRKGKCHSKETRKKISEAKPKKAVGAYKDGKLILTFESTKEAGRNGFHQSNVSECCRGNQNTHKCYQWKYL